MLIITKSQLHKIFDFLPWPKEGIEGKGSGSQRSQGAKQPRTQGAGTNGPIAGDANWLLSTQTGLEKVGRKAEKWERELVTKDESLARRNPFQC